MPAIGIDLGTTHCCVGIWKEDADTDEDDRVEIIINDLGKRVTPSCVAFTGTERVVGALAKAQARHNPKNTCDPPTVAVKCNLHRHVARTRCCTEMCEPTLGVAMGP